MEFQIICHNNSNKPAEYPSSDKWLEKDKTYSPIKISYLVGGVIGVKVEEITPSEDNPFQYFDLKRFAIPADQFEDFMKWVDDQLQNQEEDTTFDVSKLLEEELVN